ncbi:MAG: flagellar biosynthesis anti-sigma factor FlgM [Deltaproteobacteria bacterium]|nr:flagellar biosynthesis anti-sigma factor FlgM [Deltaproteobacteria bacterium]
MKVGGKKTGVGTDNYVKKAGGAGDQIKKAENSPKPSAGDNVDISPKAKDLNKAKTLLESVPELRGEIVGKLKTDIENGNYEVDSGKVAEKIIERAITNALSVKK